MKKIFHQPKLKQITVMDERFYTDDDIRYQPSVTSILEVYPKGHGFNQWLKDVGANATEIANRAAERGSNVHAATELIDKGLPVSFFRPDGSEAYSRDEWEMICRYLNPKDDTCFTTACNPIMIANEQGYVSHSLGYGGTIDRIFEIHGLLYLVDIKTSNYLHKSHELQCAAYAQMWNQKNPEYEIDNTAILWLNAKTKTAKIDFGKQIYQGKEVR